MNKTPEKLWRIGEFAKLTGVTVRTLRYYDRKDILRPLYVTEAGYRLYSAREMVRLQHILTLKMLDYSLATIRLMLDEADELAQAERLQSQRQLLAQKRNRLDAVIEAIDKAQKMERADGQVSWQSLLTVIEVMTMKPSKETQQWTKQFYTEEQQQNLAARNYSEEDALRDAAVWNELIAEVNASLDLDPASEQAQALADRWQALIQAFTQGDSRMHGSLNNLWANADKAPSEFRAYAEKIKPAGDFIQKALAAREK